MDYLNDIIEDLIALLDEHDIPLGDALWKKIDALHPSPRCWERAPGGMAMRCMRAKGHAGEHCPIERCERHPDP